MPDTRSHRGARPEDAVLFAASAWPTLRQASAELWWLLDRGYALKSSLALVGDRHGLAQRQRIALGRGACAADRAEARRARQVPATALRGIELWIDGYNLLISIEAALAGGVVLCGRDRCFRDLASLHGTYRTVTETTPAIEMMGEALAAWGVGRCRWLLDRPVSNSGRLKGILLATAAAHGWPWMVELEFNPDRLLSECGGVVASSDSVVLDRCAQWVNAAAEIVATCIPAAHVVDLNGRE